MKFILGGLKREASGASKTGGPGACPRENYSFPRPLFRSLENAPFLENVLLTEAKDHDL